VAHKPIYVDHPETQDPRVLYNALKSEHAVAAAQEAIMRKLLLKFRGWEYEDEIRLLARLDGKPGEHSYFHFGNNLALREVIVGVRSSVSKTENAEQLRSYSTAIRIRKARLSRDTFQVVEDPNGVPA